MNEPEPSLESFFDESADGAVIGSIHAIAEEMIVRVARGTATKQEIIDAFAKVANDAEGMMVRRGESPF